MPVITSLRKLRQEDHKLKDSLSCIATLKIAWTPWQYLISELCVCVCVCVLLDICLTVIENVMHISSVFTEKPNTRDRSIKVCYHLEDI